MAAAATTKLLLQLVRQRNRGAIQQVGAREPFENRRQCLIRPNDKFGCLAKHLLQKVDQLRRMSLLDRLRRDIGTALCCHLSQLLIRGLGILKEAQDESPSKR